MSEKWLIVYGDPVDGFSFMGPFDRCIDADEYAEAHNLGHYAKTVARLEAPK